MNDRREFMQLAAVMALALPTAAVQAADEPRGGLGEIARYPLGGALAGYDAVLVDLRPRPGAPNSAGHRHPGFVLGYVIEGAYGFSLDGATPRAVQAGETFFEDAGALHTGTSSAGDKPAHVLAFMVVPTGSSLVVSA
jgi:hypothetical protein